MDNELRLGPTIATDREYVVVRRRDRNCAEGWAFGYTRGTALAESVRMLSAQLLSPSRVQHPVTDPVRALRSLFPNAWPDMARAASLIEIASATMTTAESGRSRPPETYCVVGYFPQRGHHALLQEAADELDAGAVGLKLMMSNDPIDDVRLIRSLRAQFPSVPLGVDAHGLFDTVEAAAAFGATLLDNGVAFLEDPFRGRPLTLLRSLKKSVPIPLAIGEDLTDTDYVEELIEAADIVRVDATVSGGLGAAAEIARLAQRAGREVFPHAFPSVHAQLAQVLDKPVKAIEYIPASSGADPIDRLLKDSDPLAMARFDAEELDSAALHRWSSTAEYKNQGA